MRHSRKPILTAVILALVAISSPALAQQPSAQISIDALDSARYPIVDMTVTVRDPSGVPVSDVPPSAFALYAGEQNLPITGVANASKGDGGLSVVLAFDVSGSMSGTPLETARVAGKALISQLRPNDVVSVLAFGSSVTAIQTFTNDATSLDAAIDSLTVAGNTALYEAVTQSVSLAGSATSPRRAIVLLSDGTDYGGIGTATRDTSLGAAEAGFLPIFAVGLGNYIDEGYLRDLSSASGGTLSLAASPDSLTGLYESIGAVLGRQHLVSFDASSIEGPADIRLQVDYVGGILSAETRFDPPQVPEPVAGPDGEATTPPPAEPEVAAPRVETDAIALGESPAAEETSSGSGVPLLALAIVVASPVLLLGLPGLALAYFVKRRRRSADRGELPEEVLVSLLKRSRTKANGAVAGLEDPMRPGDQTQVHSLAAALLKVTSEGIERSFPVDGAPITIGFSPDCSIVLPHTPGEHYERVRLWQRDGRFMLHNLSRSGRVTVAGKQVSWLILEDGDFIDIGGCHVLFQSV